LGGEGLLQRLAAWKALPEKTSPLGSNLLVHAVEQEDEESLKGSGDGEEDQEDGDDDIFRDEEHEVSKDPRQTDGDVDGDVDSEFLLSVALVGFGCSCEGLVDLSSNEEEEDSVG